MNITFYSGEIIKGVGDIGRPINAVDSDAVWMEVSARQHSPESINAFFNALHYGCVNVNTLKYV